MASYTREYWERFYSVNEHIPTTASSFAQFFVARLKEPLSDATLVELGCGNGRDALFFAARGVGRVLGVDLAATSIAKLTRALEDAHSAHTAGNGAHQELQNYDRHLEALQSSVRFVCADFSRLGTPSDEPLRVPQVTAVYSRFTLHAVDRETSSRALAWASAHLRDGGWLAIEARSVLGSMFGKGEPVPGERDAFINGHYRRFLRKDELVAEIQGLGFVIDLVDEAAGLAPFGDDDPVLIRVIARKKKAQS